MSSSCSIETCKRKSSVSCNFCQKNLCDKHLKEHNDELNFQLNSLSDEIKNLSNRYTLLNTNKLLNEYRENLDIWRDDSHQKIDRLYEEKSNELDQYYSQMVIKPQNDLDEIRLKMIKLIRKQKTTHENINQSIETLRYIEQQIKDIEQKRILIDFPSLSINNHFQFQNTNIFNFSLLYRTMNCSNQSGVAFNKNNQNLLIYEKHKLILFNQDLISIEEISWINGQIYDICWSKTLNYFILITDKRILYLLNENPLSFTQIKSIPQEKWWSLTCSDQHLFLTTYGTDTNIFLFDLFSSFNFLKRWRSPQTCKQHESIHDINYTNNTILLTIGDSSNKTARIELRSSITLKHYWKILIDINYISYQSTIHSCLLKDDEWIIIGENTSNIYHISKDGILKKVYQYQQPVWNAITFGSNLLAIRTENNIHFHRI